MDAIRANRQLAEKPCVACRNDVLLGDEVILCPKCGGVYHRGCWEQRGWCIAPACSPAASPAVAPAVVPPGTRPCPACGEPVPLNARMCPYCSESLATDSRVPRAFAAKASWGRNWRFAIVGNELVGTRVGKGEEIRVPHERGPLEVVVKKRRFTVTTGGRTRKFTMADDIAPVVLTYWLTGRLEPCPSFAAQEALSYSIVGILFFQIILSPYALYKAGEASKAMKAYPGLLTGEGKVLAARIISITVLSLIALVIIINIMFAASR